MGDGQGLHGCDGYLYTLTQWLGGDGVDINKTPKIAEHFPRVGERPAVRKAVEDETGTAERGVSGAVGRVSAKREPAAVRGCGGIASLFRPAFASATSASTFPIITSTGPSARRHPSAPAISAIVPATIVSSGRVAFAIATAGVAGSSPSAIARALNSRSVFFGM